MSSKPMSGQVENKAQQQQHDLSEQQPETAADFKETDTHSSTLTSSDITPLPADDDPTPTLVHEPTTDQTAPLDVEGEELEEDDLLATSAGDNEVGKLLRTTVEELETALQDSRHLLAERDEELITLRSELDHYKQQAAKEIANKTKLAQALDESHRHARELEELLQRWQLEIRESKLHGERLQSQLQRDQARAVDMERRLSGTLDEKEKEIEQLRTQLVDTRQKLNQQAGTRRSSSIDTSTIAASSNPGPKSIDEMQLHFLKQAVYHLLTDFHAEDQLRAIISILDFSAQERKAVYAKVQEKKRTARGLYM